MSEQGLQWKSPLRPVEAHDILMSSPSSTIFSNIDGDLAIVSVTDLEETIKYWIYYLRWTFPRAKIIWFGV